MKKDIPKDFIRRMKSYKTAQAVNLAIWAGLNVLVGSIFIFQAQTHHFYFFTMNISWNMVNLCVAVFLYTHHNDVFSGPISILNLLNQMDFQRHIEKSIIFNLGLDMTFMATGFAMYYYGKIPQVDHPNLWLGFGISVILQGSFLLIQDLVFYRLHRINQSKVYPYWQNVLESVEGK